MTFKTVFLQLLVFLNINSFSQTGKFILKPNWKKGEVKELKVSGEFFWVVNGQKDKSSEPTKTYQIEILESNENGYLVEWKVSYNETNEDEFMQNYIDNFNYQIQLDKNGKFIELKNWHELIELNKSLKEKIVSMAKLVISV